MIREALLYDIPKLHLIRNAVNENKLSDPDLIKQSDYEDFITRRGKGWVYEMQGSIAGFAVVDLQENNVWALFVHPDFEKLGIGRELHDKMLRWYFSHHHQTLWLSTAPATRAESFYRKAGWKETGLYGKGEIRFEMYPDIWVPVVSG